MFRVKFPQHSTGYKQVENRRTEKSETIKLARQSETIIFY